MKSAPCFCLSSCYYSNGPNIETAPGIQSVSCPGSGYYFAFCTITFNGICADVGNLAGVNCVSNNGRLI